MIYRLLIITSLILGIIFITKSQIKDQEFFLTNSQINATSISTQSLISNQTSAISQIPEPLPSLQLESALAKNLTTNFYYIKININQRWPLASLTKLLTAVVALETNLETDNEQKTKELVGQMMVVSNNDAANKLAELSGNREEFIKKMRLKAQELGMSQTSIFEPTGLSFLNQSTISDLEKLVDYIIKNHPLIFQLSRQPSVVINNKKEANINKFAGQPNFLGGKTGYTDEANGNLVSLFQNHGQPLLIIVLGTNGYEERFKQTDILRQWVSNFYK